MKRDVRPRSGAEGPEVVLDISRLLARALHTTPTGVDRVEMAYATDLIARIPDRLCFAAVHPAGVYGRLPRGAVRQFLASTGSRWRHGGSIDPMALRTMALRHWLALWPRPVPAARGARVYLQSSPHHLERGDKVRAILRKENAAFVCLVHDLIPIVHPEYARADGAKKHLRRVRSVADHAAGIVCNSAATLETLIPFLQAVGHRPALRIAHLGAERHDPADGSAGDRPPIAGAYFVCVSTIEPRKNHLLLLNIWRRLVERLGSAAPKLVLIGRRGWENEQVVDMLERCTALRDHVIEHGDMPDRDMRGLLAGACAVMLPSFAEGFGMPVIEALIDGIPVIAADLPALREAGGDVPEFLDPLDGIGWMQAILDYAEPGSPRRAAQIQRIAAWSPPSWRAHLDIVMDLVDSVALRPAMRG